MANNESPEGGPVLQQNRMLIVSWHTCKVGSSSCHAHLQV